MLEIEDQRREQTKELLSKPEPAMAFRVQGGGALVVQVQLANQIAGVDHGVIHEHETLPPVAGHPQPQDVPTPADRANVIVTLDTAGPANSGTASSCERLPRDRI